MIYEIFNTHHFHSFFNKAQPVKWAGRSLSQPRGKNAVDKTN
jgi:hypothetical protein